MGSPMGREMASIPVAITGLYVIMALFRPRTALRALLPRRAPLVARLQSTARPSRPCPSCGRPLASNLPACTACGSIHPLPPNVPHHALFGLPVEPNPFAIDLPTMKQRFREAQASCHPDAWASKSSVRALCPTPRWGFE